MNIDRTKQQEIVKHISETFVSYEQQTAVWRTRMGRIYEGVTTFTQTKSRPRETNFKINKMHEIENRIVPRIMSKNPKPIVSYKPDYYLQTNQDVSQITNAIQDRLEEMFCKQDMSETLRLWAKAMVRYGIGIVKISPKYRLKRDTQQEVVYDEMGNEILQKKIKEEVYEIYAGIDVKSRTDMYFDPRYTRLEDMPSVIDITRNARLSYFTKNKDKYMNLDKLVACCVASTDTRNDFDGYKNKVFAITGIQPKGDKIIKPDTLDIKCFYGLYDMSDDDSMKNERLYEFWTVNDVILVYAEEITELPFEEIRCFEDTETYFATGFIEPILGLQDELNFKKNKASEYVNKTLNPDHIRSPISGIDPRKLNQGHGNILVTNKDAQTALANFVQLPRRELNSSYFNEQNDLERQIQAATFTVNTNSPLTQNSLTNTATGAKIQSFETDSVTGEVRKHLEEGLVRLAYKLLQFEFEYMDDILTIKKRDKEDEYWNIHKEALRDAVSKYEIQIEAGSSSYDSEEVRRNDAIAQWNIGLQAQQAGLPVNLKGIFQKVLSTFQGYDESKVFDMMSQLPQQGMQGASTLPMQQSQAPSTQVK